jgi:ABC-type sugar transport system substrate-binding protein
MIGRLRSAGVRIGILLAGSMMGVVAGGCGTGDFVPPPPAELRDQASGGSRNATAGSSKPVIDPYTGEGSRATIIEMVWARGRDPESEGTDKSAARSQAGLDRSRIRILPDDDPEPANSTGTIKHETLAKSQAQFVRDALGRTQKPQALIVEPEDPSDSELARAVEEARAAKMPVVLLGRPLDGVKGLGNAPVILVKPQSFTESAQKLVTLSMRNARNAKLNPEAGAILLIPAPGDAFIPDRVAAVREALEVAKVSPVDEIRMTRDIDDGAKRLTKRLEADSKTAMVFAFDFVSTSACNKVATNIGEKRPFIQAGYTSDDSLPRMALAGEFAGIADYVPVRLVRKAVSTAVAAAQGREINNPVEVQIPVRESPPGATSPKIQAQQNKTRRQANSRGGDEG